MNVGHLDDLGLVKTTKNEVFRNQLAGEHQPQLGHGLLLAGFGPNKPVVVEQLQTMIHQVFWNNQVQVTMVYNYD